MPKQYCDSVTSRISSLPSVTESKQGSSALTDQSTTQAVQNLDLDKSDTLNADCANIESANFQDSLPNELWDATMQELDGHSLVSLMTANRKWHDLVTPYLYRDITFRNIHNGDKGTPLSGLAKGQPAGMPWSVSRVADPSEITSAYKEKLLELTKVVRLSYGCCDLGVPRPPGFIKFPNLITLHKTDMEPCESTEPDCIACHIFENGATQPHTLVLRNSSLQGTWRKYCFPVWNPSPWSQVKRIVWCHTDDRKLVWQSSSTEKPRPAENISSLETVNIVFPRTSPARVINAAITCELSEALANICASAAQHVVIAGLEGLRPKMVNVASSAGSQPPISCSANLSQEIQARVEEATRKLLKKSKMTQMECQEQWKTRAFVSLEAYAKQLNHLDELDSAELGLDKPTEGPIQQTEDMLGD